MHFQRWSYPLGVTCTEITEAELELRSTVKETTIKSDGTIYTTPNISRLSEHGVILPDIVKIYKRGDLSCSFYSMRNGARKKYWTNNIPAEKYSQPNSEGQILSYYSEIGGVTQEWYYDFTTFEGMMAFVNSHAAITLNPTLEAKMRNNPVSVRPDAIVNSNCMYLASLEIAASGAKTTTIYVTAQPEDL